MLFNSPSAFTYYLDLSNFILESGLSYFRVLTICLLLVYFVNAAGCHCFDSYQTSIKTFGACVSLILTYGGEVCFFQGHDYDL